jgi:hypothetical protein
LTKIVRSVRYSLLGAFIVLIAGCRMALVATPTAAAVSSSATIIADCKDHGGLTGNYSVAELRNALQVMPPEDKEYTSCQDVLNRALLADISTPTTGSGGPGGGSGSFLPTPVIAILVVLFLVAVTFGAVAVRRRRRPSGKDVGRVMLHIERADQETQRQLWVLGERLPEPLSIGSRSSEFWVSFPHDFGEAKAREEIRKAIDRAHLHLITVA